MTEPEYNHYLVVAYRWGAINDHQYIVGCFIDDLEAQEIAEEECSSRGGKYGVAVYGFIGQDCELLSYFPSSHGEDAPHRNTRIALFERFGNEIVPRVEVGETVDHGEMIELIRREKALIEYKKGV